MKIWIAKDNTSAALTTIFTGSKPVLDGEGFWWQPCYIGRYDNGANERWKQIVLRLLEL